MFRLGAWRTKFDLPFSFSWLLTWRSKTISLRRDVQQAKILAYTAECIHARDSEAKITAITEEEIADSNPNHRFVEKLFAAQEIEIVPMNRVEGFAEKLRLSLH
jgi:hypothetical protein